VHVWSEVVKFRITCPGSDRLVSGLGHSYLEVFRGFTFLFGCPIKIPVKNRKLGDFRARDVVATTLLLKVQVF